ncbi:MAG: MIT C-terminal domain-containing protein [Desulfomonilaceae bacterium]
MSDMIHVMVTWSPRPNFHPDAPRGITLWAEILDRFEYQGDQCFCWWGKVSVSGDLGMTQDQVELLNHQIQRQRVPGGQETHLYIFSADPKLGMPSLHVGSILEVKGEDDRLRSDLHAPRFFGGVKEPIPFWFKISDLRVIPPKRIDDLLLYPSDKPFDPNTKIPMPLLLKEKPQKTFFAEKTLKESGWKYWWKQILYGGPTTFPPVHKMISIEEGSIYNYQNLFGDHLKSAKEIRIVDPYIRKSYQTRNIVELLSLAKEPRKTRVALETLYDEGMEAVSRRLLDDLKDTLVGKGFDFSWSFNQSIHDRFIETERWEIYLGRGLDFISKEGKTKRCNIFFVQK